MLKLIGKLWTKMGGKPLKSQVKTPPDKEQTTQISEIKAAEIGQDVLWDLSELSSHDICDITKQVWKGQTRSNSLIADAGADCAYGNYSASGCTVKDNRGACVNDNQVRIVEGGFVYLSTGSQTAHSDSHGRGFEYEQIRRDSIVALNSNILTHASGDPSVKNNSNSNEVVVSKVIRDEIKILPSTSSKGTAEKDTYLVKLKHEYDELNSLNGSIVSVNEKETYLKTKNEFNKTFFGTQKLNNSQNDQTAVNNSLPCTPQAAKVSPLAVHKTAPSRTKGNRKPAACINNLSTDMGAIASRNENVVNDVRPQLQVKLSNNEISIKDNLKSAAIQGVSVKHSEPHDKFSALTKGNLAMTPLSSCLTNVCREESILCDVSDSPASAIILDPSSGMRKNNEPQCPLKCLNDSLSADEHDVKDKEAEGLALSVENLSDLLEDVNGLHNHEGNLCTIGNKRFIKAGLRDPKRIVYVNTGVKEFSGAGTKLGCRVLWRDQSPIPLSSLKDGTKVSFDAIFLPERKIYQALVIWQKTKPKYVTEPSLRSYIWIDSRVFTCEEIVSISGTNYGVVHYDHKKVCVKFPEDYIFVDGEKANVLDLVACKTSASPIYATVNRLMTSTKGAEFHYVCSCVWSGVRPSTDKQPSKMFQRGEVYRLNSQNVFVRDSSPCRLYCDWPAFLNVTENKCTLTFEIENLKLSLPLSENKVYVGKFKAQPTLSLMLPVTAHFQKISRGHWLILQVHPPKKEKNRDVFAPTNQTEGEVDINTGKNTLEKVLPVNSEAPLQISRKTGEHEQPIKTTSGNAQPKCPRVLQAVTGHIFCVKGDYGILKIRHREIAVHGVVLAAFHRSVGYVDQWPLYKDVPFHEQINDLMVGIWHCSLRISKKVIEGIPIRYEATLAWQGRKPTMDIIAFYKKEPNSSDFYFSECCKIDVKKGKRKKKTTGTTAASYSVDSLSDLMQALSLDDLFPTSAGDDERDIVDVGAVDRL